MVGLTQPDQPVPEAHTFLWVIRAAFTSVVAKAVTPKHLNSSGVSMKTSFLSCTATMLCLASLCATAETVTPLKGQTPEIIQQDIGACQAQAGSTSGTSTSPQTGGRVRGAATGAVAGAAVAGARGRQYDEVADRVDDDVKQQYRQNKAKDAAVAGAVVGGSRQRQDRREDRRSAEQNTAAASSAYTSCMQQRGYQVTP